MTCAHVLGLIDAGPFAGYPRAHLEAAWQHARQCATCGPALRTAAALTTDLAALPQAAPPPDLAASVLARIAQIDQAQHSAAAVPETWRHSGTRDWPTWAAALGGVAGGLAIILSMPPDGGTAIDIASLRLDGMTPVAAMPATATGAIVLAAGLALYAAGLFAPLAGRSRPNP